MTDLTKEMKDALELAKKIVLAHGYALNKLVVRKAKLEPRPYTLGDEIKAEDYPTMRVFALMEHTDSLVGTEIFVMNHYASLTFDTCWYGGQHYKEKCTHLDGTPLGEFRAVPLRGSGVPFPHDSNLPGGGWSNHDRNRVNDSILAFRDKLGEADDVPDR